MGPEIPKLENEYFMIPHLADKLIQLQWRLDPPWMRFIQGIRDDPVKMKEITAIMLKYQAEASRLEAKMYDELGASLSRQR